MKILVTGAAGYLGSIFCELALRLFDYEVIALDNFMYGVPSLASCCAYPQFQLVIGDVRDHELMRKHLERVDAYVPLAAIVGAPACANNDQAWAINFSAIERTARYNSKLRLVYPMTNSGYGIGTSAPCTEESPLTPISEYGKQKVRAEHYVLQAGGVSLRFATLFGMSPRMRLDLLVNDFCWRALNDRSVVLYEPGFRRNFLHVRDAASAIFYALYHYETMSGKSYNVGIDDANLTKAELCERIKSHVPGFEYVVSDVGKDPDKRDYIVSNDRILSAGWCPALSLDDGIKELIKGLPMLRMPWRNA